MRTLFLALLIGLGGLADACEKPNRFEKAAKRAAETTNQELEVVEYYGQFASNKITLDEFLDLVNGIHAIRRMKDAEYFEKELDEIEGKFPKPRNKMCLKYLGFFVPSKKEIYEYEVIECPKEEQ